MSRVGCSYPKLCVTSDQLLIAICSKVILTEVKVIKNVLG